MKAGFLQIEEVLRDWEKMAPLFENVVNKACHGEFTVDDLLAMAVAGYVLIFVCRKEDEIVLAAALEFRSYPQHKAMNVMAFGGGHMHEAMNCFFDTVKDAMAEIGVSFLEASCSRAMARILAKYGFVPVYQQLRLNLKKEGGEDDYFQ